MYSNIYCETTFYNDTCIAYMEVCADRFDRLLTKSQSEYHSQTRLQIHAPFV